MREESVKHVCLRSVAIGVVVLALAAFVSSCASPTPPRYESGSGYEYCSSVLEVARHYIAINTPVYIVLLIFGVILGGMGLYSNDSNRKRWFMRHLGTIFGLVAVSCGVGAVYTQSRADAASRAASEVEQALIARKDRVQYELCLDIAARWDNSRTASTAAVSSMAVEKADRVTEATSDLVDALKESANSDEDNAEAADQTSEAVEELLDALRESGAVTEESAEKVDKAKEKLRSARKNVKSAKQSAEKVRAAAGQAVQKIEMQSQLPPEETP